MISFDAWWRVTEGVIFELNVLLFNQPVLDAKDDVRLQGFLTEFQNYIWPNKTKLYFD